MCRIKTKVWATVVSGEIYLKNYKEWLNSIKSELKNTRFNDGAVVLTIVLNIAVKITTTRWGFTMKSDRRFKARHIVFGCRYNQYIDCGITLVSRFGLLVIASAKRFNIPDVQTVLLSWFLDKNELNQIYFSKLYQGIE